MLTWTNTGAGRRRPWLLYGERQAAHDRPCRDELEAWLASGVLARLDLAFSRDQARRVYVQDKLREQAALLRRWVDERGAALYVCGSLNGMAQGVDEALREVLGQRGGRCPGARRAVSARMSTERGEMLSP